MKSLVIFLFLFSLYSCVNSSNTNSPTVVYSACSVTMETAGTCTRFMDRDVYFANNIATQPLTNNSFNVLDVQAALNDLTSNTSLGNNYFRFHMTDAVNLNVINSVTSGVNFISFIQIIPDLDYYDTNDINHINPHSGFNTLWNSGSYSDPNAIVIVNQANKRQFYILLRQSCFTSNSTSCTDDAAASFTSNKGLYSLVDRAIGRLVGLTNVDCTTYPNQLMCAQYPNDNQWSTTEQNRTYSLINNALETVSQNANFYQQVFSQ